MYMCGVQKGQGLMPTKILAPRLSETAVFEPFRAGSRVGRAFAFAFADAEDYSNCVWPPTTYTCSFCTREFRSAQALGGHMNVHRRDRARLKHSQEADHQVHILETNIPRLGSKNLPEDSRKFDALVEDPARDPENSKVRTDLSVGLSSEPAMRSSCKRAKPNHHHHHHHHDDVSSRLPLMLGLVRGVLEPTTTRSKNNIINSNRYHHEELDLELRLGAH